MDLPFALHPLAGIPLLLKPLTDMVFVSEQLVGKQRLGDLLLFEKTRDRVLPLYGEHRLLS